MSDRSPRTVLELLTDIISWGERIPALLGEMSFEDFEKDYKTHLAVWKSIEVIGEASGRLLQAQFPAEEKLRTELRLAYQMRNRLTHGYPGVDLQVLWNTARAAVPPLLGAVRSSLSQQRSGES